MSTPLEPSGFVGASALESGGFALNQQIVSAAYQVIRGEIPEPTAPGYCLRLVRTVIEHAVYEGRYRLYEQVLKRRVDPDLRASNDPYARDLEANLRDFGMDVPGLERADGPPGDPARYISHIQSSIASGVILPGDLLFRWDVVRDQNGVFVGHVAILLDHGLVLENVAARPGRLSRGPTFLSVAGDWPVTSVMRFNPERLVAPA